jgi:hypothetical protein
VPGFFVSAARDHPHAPRYINGCPMPLDSAFENDNSQPWWQIGPPLRITVHPAPPAQSNGSASDAATNQIEPDGYPNDWFVPQSDGYPNDWYVPSSSGTAPSNTNRRSAPKLPGARTTVPFGAIEPDGYPNDWVESDGFPDDWFVPEPDGYPNDWYVPNSSGAPPSNASRWSNPTTAGNGRSVPFGAIEPDGYPNDWIGTDGYPDDWFVPNRPGAAPNNANQTVTPNPLGRSSVPYGAIEPDGYPNDWLVPNNSSTAPSNTSKLIEPTAANNRTPIPFGAIEPDGYPNDWIESDGYPDGWYVPASSLQPSSSHRGQRSIDSAPGTPEQSPNAGLIAPNPAFPFQARSDADVKPSTTVGDFFLRLLNALNPISPAYAADDEDEIPSELLAVLLHGLDPEIAKKLIEQHRFWGEWRKDLFEVSQGRASSRALARHLEASGIQRLPGYAAHHIAAGADPRGQFARSVLRKFGIGINDVMNGVFLPANRATQVIAGETIHSTLHTKEYYDGVNEELMDAKSRQEVIDRLRNIAVKLQFGDYP